MVQTVLKMKMKSFKCQTAERKQLLVEKLINAAFGF